MTSDITASADPSNVLLRLRMIMLSRISPDLRDQRNTNALQRKTRQEAADTSSTCSIARQKPGRVVVRHICD